jgi:hypothetical protein
MAAQDFFGLFGQVMAVLGVTPAQLTAAGDRKAPFATALCLELRHFYVSLFFVAKPATPKRRGRGKYRDKFDGWACLKPRHLYGGPVCSHSDAKLQVAGLGNGRWCEIGRAAQN